MQQMTHCMTRADLIQLAGALSLEEVGGPAVPFTAGRRASKVYPPEGRLPIADKSAYFATCSFAAISVSAQIRGSL